MSFSPPIVVIAYNRPLALRRLLDSLVSAHYEEEQVPLIISIDKGDNREVVQMAQELDWPFGKKEVLEQPQNLGLKNHILQSGDLSTKYGSIIMLEDDLYVSPFFYNYAKRALAFFGGDPQIAGISLYHYQRTESTLDLFHPLDDGAHNYFMQLPCSWGQAWTSAQWQAFRHWLNEADAKISLALLPNYIQAWSERSWKKFFAAYLLAKDKYFVYPRLSLTTNFGDPGANYKGSDWFQVRLQHQPHHYHFHTLAQSQSRYDAWFEPEASILKAENPRLAAYDFSIDLLGAKQKNEIPTDWVLTTQKNHASTFSFATTLQPPILNVLKNIPGEDIHFCQKTDLKENRLIKWHNRMRKYYYSKAKLRNKLTLATERFWERWI